MTFQFTPVTHMVYLEIRLHYFDFAIEKLTSSNWISKYTMCVTGVNWKVKFLSACRVKTLHSLSCSAIEIVQDSQANMSLRM